MQRVRHGSWRLAMPLVLAASNVSPAAAPEDSETKPAMSRTYSLKVQDSGPESPPRGFDGQYHARITVVVNSIPIDIQQSKGLGTQSWFLDELVGKGRNEFQIVGPHEPRLSVTVVESENVFHGARSTVLAKDDLPPDAPSAKLAFTASVPWPPIEADQLDTSPQGKRKAEEEIEAILRKIEDTRKSGDRESIRALARELFLPWTLRLREVRYALLPQPKMPTKDEILEQAMYLATSYVDPGEVLLNPDEEPRFVHGERGVLVYRGFREAFTTYLYYYRDKEGRELPMEPFAFIRNKGKWQIIVP